MQKNKIIKPISCANNLVSVWRKYGNNTPNIDVEILINEFINQQYKSEKIEVFSVDSDFEGVLIKSGQWKLLYNQNIKNIGRKNFTIAHELGHYLFHRHLQDQFNCGNKELYDSKIELETEANTFASYLLMPIDDFKEQIKDCKIDFNLFEYCSNRYQTSLKAVILKWLEFTHLCAALVISTDEFVLWSRSSVLAFKKGIYFRSGLELPEKSFAKQKQDYQFINNPLVEKGIWHNEYSTIELSFYSDVYDKTITLLIFQNVSKSSDELNEEELEDCFDRFNKFNN